MSEKSPKWRPHQGVLVIIGGHAQRLIPYMKSMSPRVTDVLVLDAAKEIDDLTSVPRKTAASCRTSEGNSRNASNSPNRF